MSRSKITVFVNHKEHCNIDSFPLRFGFTFTEDMECTLLLESESTQDARYEDRTLYQGALIHPESDERYYGTFVVAQNRGRNTLVTAWRNDIDTEYYLSAVMKMLREAKVLDTQELLKLHERYKRNELTSHASLVLALSENKSAAQVSHLQQQADFAINQTKAQLRELERENEYLKMRNTSLQQQGELKELIHQMKSSKSATNSHSTAKDTNWKVIVAVLVTLLVAVLIYVLSSQSKHIDALSQTSSNSATNPSNVSNAPIIAMSSNQAISRVGEFGTVCGKIVQITEFDKGTYLNFDKPFPNMPFTAVIWRSDHKRVVQDTNIYTRFSNQHTCVTGQITQYKNKAQIFVKNPDQLTVH